MTSNRFRIIPVNESKHDNQIPKQLSESIPLISIDKDPPQAPPISSSLTLINEKTKSSPRLINSFLQRLKTSSSTNDFKSKTDSSSLPINQTNSNVNLNINNKEVDDAESYNSTLHTTDTNSFRLTDKFLHEIRLKRRELHEKSQNVPIDQRIALNRFQYQQELIRAQDIFDVHFVLDDDMKNNAQGGLFDKDNQQRIRTRIFNELDRQRMKQYHKQRRQLVLGRALLMFITSVLLFMSITLVYVVVDLYDRANSFDSTMNNEEFISMIYDSTANE